LFSTVALGVFIVKFYRKNVSRQIFEHRNVKNELGKAMVNMERASIFNDCANFYEFALYAVDGATGQRREKAAAADDIKNELESHGITKKTQETVVEIYKMAEKVSQNGDVDIDLKSKLSAYYEAIRELHETFNRES
jgi:hypothetical protein